MSFAESHQPGNCASHNEMLRLHSQWQTPATDSFRSRGGDRKDEMGLDQQARHWPLGTNWPTPATIDATRTGQHVRQMTLDSGARGFRKGISLHHEVAHWPTPAARDHKGANSTEHVETNGTGRCHLDQLPNFVEHCFSPQDQATHAGQQSSETRRVLNPQFVEWLMGWPIGWTVSEPVETGLCHWLQLSRGALSMLCSQPTQQPDLFG
jgi:DNA (cytosine-5)-methyltransferase 1